MKKNNVEREALQKERMVVNKLSEMVKQKDMLLTRLQEEVQTLEKAVADTKAAIKTLEEELKTEKQKKEKLMSDFESERLVLQNMVTVTESVMEDQKVSLNKIIAGHVKVNQNLEEEVNNLKRAIEMERKDAEIKLQDKCKAFKTVFKELTDIRKEKETIERELASEKESFEMKVAIIDEISEKTSRIDTLTNENKDIHDKLIEQTKGMTELEEQNNEAEFGSKVKTLQEDLDAQYKRTNELELLLISKETENEELLENINQLKISIVSLEQEKSIIEKEKSNICQTIVELKDALVQRTNESDVLLSQSKNEITELKTANDDMKTRIKLIRRVLANTKT